MNIQEKFNEVKDHPLVILLLKYYAKKSVSPIPTIWQTFIRDSTESTDLSLMYTQLDKWNIPPEAIPPNLFGSELLSHLLNLKFQGVLNQIQTEMTTRKLGIIPAIEAVFRATKIIPHGIVSNNVSSKYGIRTSLQYNYKETGTLSYTINRSVPAEVLIPASFIRASFKPEYSDLQIWRRFLEGLDTRFRSPQETLSTNASFEWVMKLLHEPQGSCINTQTGARLHGSEAFPLKIAQRCSDSECSSTLILSHPRPDPVTGNTVRFAFPKNSCNRITNLYASFPVLSVEDRNALSAEEACDKEPEQHIFTHSLAGFLDNPDSPEAQPVWREFITALRATYDRLTETETFQAQRKEALERAAGI